jgi:hypothetical protein
MLTARQRKERHSSVLMEVEEFRSFQRHTAFPSITRMSGLVAISENLPGKTPAVLAPAAHAFLASVADDGVPQAVGLGLVLGEDDETDRLVGDKLGTAVVDKGLWNSRPRILSTTNSNPSVAAAEKNTGKGSRF